MALAGSARANTPVQVGPSPHSVDGIETLDERDGPLTLFLNLDGVALSAGRGGSHHDESLVMLARRIGSMAVPRYSGSRADRERLVACVRDVFARYRMRIVTARPAVAPYIMATVGGRSSGLGLSAGVTGIAPFNGGVMTEAVVFAFERRDRGPISVCNTVAHEVGHALGLRHAYKRGELMSYLSYGGQRSFMDADASCGEWRARTCAAGKPSQNSHAHLASILGLRPAPAPPAPEEEPEPGPDPEPAPPAVAQAPAPPRALPPRRVAAVRPPAPPARSPVQSPGPARRPSAVSGYRVQVNFTTRGGETYRRVSCSGTRLIFVARCLRSHGLRLVAHRTPNHELRLSVKRIPRHHRRWAGGL